MLELVPFESLKDLLDLEGDSYNDLPALGILKLSVQTAIEAELGRQLESKERTVTRHLVSFETDIIDLKAIPVTSVSSITVDGVALESNEYRIVTSGVQLSAKYKNVDVVVTYTGGLAQDDLPEEIARAALLQTCYEWQNKEHIGASSVSTAGGSVSTPALQLLPVVVNILDGVKHPMRIS